MELSPAAANLRILQIHGDEDSVVAFEWGEGTSKLLKTLITDPEPLFLTITVQDKVFLFIIPPNILSKNNFNFAGYGS